MGKLRPRRLGGRPLFASAWLALGLGMLATGCATGGVGDTSPVGDDSSVSPPDTGGDVFVLPDGRVGAEGGDANRDGAGDAGLDSANEGAATDTGPDAPPDVGCTMNNQCPMNEVCDTTNHTCVGCLVDANCTTPKPHCDTSTHTCVQCLADGDCPLGQLCSNKTCTPGCNAGHGCPTSEGCCGGQCQTLSTTQNCTACGAACDAVHSTGATCNGATCLYSGCQSGYADCNTTPPDLDGCETSLTNVQDCGACGRACSGSGVQTLSCTSGGKCNSTCQAGFGNCSEPVPPNPDDGCESNLTICIGTACCGTLCMGQHSNGLGGTYSSCVPLGVPGNPATYSSTMANLAANSWSSGTISTGTCLEPDQITTDNCVGRVNASQCAVWCYSGLYSGYVELTSGTGVCGTTCCCPLTSSPTWN